MITKNQTILMFSILFLMMFGTVGFLVSQFHKVYEEETRCRKVCHPSYSVGVRDHKCVCDLTKVIKE